MLASLLYNVQYKSDFHYNPTFELFFGLSMPTLAPRWDPQFDRLSFYGNMGLSFAGHLQVNQSLGNDDHQRAEHDYTHIY